MLVLQVEVPLSQVPEQHWVPLVQVVPSSQQMPLLWHLVVVAPAQKVEQHAVPPTVQVLPLPRQLVCWQLPLTQ